MAALHPEVLDPAQLVVRVRNDLRVIHQQSFDENGAHVIEDPLRGRFYRLGEAEYTFFSLLDGSTNIEATVAGMVRKLGPRAWNTVQALAFVRWLSDQQLLVSDSLNQYSSRAALDTEADQQRQTIQGTLLSLRIKLFCPDDWLDYVWPYLGWFTGYRFFVLWLAVVVAAGGVLVFRQDPIFTGLLVKLDGFSLLLMGFAWVALKVWHELFHALVCKRFGGSVPAAGLMLILGAPCAYVDVTSTWRFANKWERIFVSLAGMYAECFVAGLAMISCCFVENPEIRLLLKDLVILSGVNSLVFNGNPLMRLDAYYALSDWLEIPNLARRSSQALVAGLLGCELPMKSLSLDAIHALRIYGICMIAWRLMVGVTTALVLTGLWGGWGAALAAVFLTYYFFCPMYSAWVDVRTWIKAPSRLAYFRPLVALAALVIVALCWVFSPHSLRLPAIVDFRPTIQVRAATAGFVRRIHVGDGQMVRAGDELFVLENPELETEREALALSIEQSYGKSRMFVAAGETAKAQAEEATKTSLEKQLSECTQKHALLNVRAATDGIFLGRRLEDRLGTWIEAGDILGVLGDDQQKEVVALIEQDTIKLWGCRLGSAAQIHTHPVFGQPVPARILRLDPRGMRDVEYPALSATNHGPIAVEQVAPNQDHGQRQTEQWLSPMFRLTAEVSSESSAKLPTGQVCWINVSADAWTHLQSIAQSAAQTVRRLVNQAER